MNACSKPCATRNTRSTQRCSNESVGECGPETFYIYEFNEAVRYFP